MSGFQFKRGPLDQGYWQQYHQRIMAVQPQAMIGAWPMWDAAGPTVTNRKAISFTGDIMANGDMEGGYAPMYYQTGTGAIADEAVLVHGGSKAVKLTAGASANTYVMEILRVTPGASYSLSIYTRGDGTYGGRYLVRSVQTNGNIIGLTNTGITGTSYTQVTNTINVPATTSSIALYLYCPATNGGICYFDDVTVTGTVLSDGAYGVA